MQSILANIMLFLPQNCFATTKITSLRWNRVISIVSINGFVGGFMHHQQNIKNKIQIYDLMINTHKLLAIYHQNMYIFIELMKTLWTCASLNHLTQDLFLSSQLPRAKSSMNIRNVRKQCTKTYEFCLHH